MDLGTSLCFGLNEKQRLNYNLLLYAVIFAQISSLVKEPLYDLNLLFIGLV